MCIRTSPQRQHEPQPATALKCPKDAHLDDKVTVVEVDGVSVFVCVDDTDGVNVCVAVVVTVTDDDVVAENDGVADGLAVPEVVTEGIVENVGVPERLVDTDGVSEEEGVTDGLSNKRHRKQKR